jgi:1-phosphatidylinositol-3-phosphate 5-kinase
MFHLRVMLRQMLTKESVSNVKEWEETLLKLALQIARDLTFTSMSSSMDVRQHVKIKKIPGGAPRDSEYVDGAVITKNVAHKQMARTIRNPRVMLVTFPFEFHRVEGQYMHLDPLVNQEKQYLTNLVGRVAALRPHVVLVEKSVSRIALEALVEHNIAVSRSVKPSAIQLVARMTQADVFSSMDKLAVEPRLGHCAQYRLQTFDHALIPGRRKTYMRFEGCSRDMGCTIILRGANLETLQRIKNVTRFLAFVVRHLKMETHLWKDSVITLPPVTADAVPAPLGSVTSSARPRTLSTHTLSYFASGGLGTPTLFSPPQQRWMAPAMAEGPAMAPAIADESALEDEDLPHDDAAQLRLSRRIQQSVEPYLKTFISISATLRFPPPYPIRRMKELDDLLQELKCAWEDDVILKEEKASSLSRNDREVSLRANSDLNTGLATPDLPKTPTPGDAAISNLGDSVTGYFDAENTSADSGLVSMRDSIASIVVPPIENAEGDDDLTVVEKPKALKDVADIAKESALSLAQFQHDEHRPVWEWYLRKNSDDFVIEHYQTLTVRQFMTPLADLDHCKPCATPQLTYFTFYGENDCTLGQYIERSISEGFAHSLEAKTPCTGCEQSLAAHCKVYVHNESKLLASTEPWSGKIQAKTLDAPVYDLITTWSVCRRCGQATPFIPVSEETLRYSFAKFLELHFYPADVLIVPGAGCSHNIYLDHARYFAFKGMTVRFQADLVVLQEIVFPPRRIRVRPETLLELKNSDYLRMLDRGATWFAALIHDLQFLLIELGDTDAETSIKATAYIREANGHRLQMARDIHTIYTESPPTDTLALGRARQLLQDRMVDWQVKIDALAKPRLSQMTFKEPRRATTFGTVRHIWPSRRNESSTTLDRLPSTNVSEVEEEYLRRVDTSSSLAQSSASENDSASEGRRVTYDPPSQSESEKGVPVPTVLIPTESLPQELAVAQGLPSSPPRSPVLAKLQKSEKSDAESDSTIGARRMLSQVRVKHVSVSLWPITCCLCRLPALLSSQSFLDGPEHVLASLNWFNATKNAPLMRGRLLNCQKASRPPHVYVGLAAKRRLESNRFSLILNKAMRPMLHLDI